MAELKSLTEWKILCREALDIRRDSSVASVIISVLIISHLLDTKRPGQQCDKTKYLGIDLIVARVFKWSHDSAKRQFYRAFDAVVGKVGRSASEEVVTQLLKIKCLPVLYYGLEVCPVNRDQDRSLDYAVHSCFRKMFSTTDQSVIEQCMIFFWMSRCSGHNKRETSGYATWFTAAGAIRIALRQLLQNRKLRHLRRHNLGSGWKLQKWLYRILILVRSTI